MAEDSEECAKGRQQRGKRKNKRLPSKNDITARIISRKTTFSSRNVLKLKNYSTESSFLIIINKYFPPDCLFEK